MLALTTDPDQAPAYLIVGHSAAWVLGVLDSDPALDPGKPLVWINAFTGALHRAESPATLRQLIESQPNCETEWLPAPMFHSLFRPIPDHKLQGGEFVATRADAVELAVGFLLGSDDQVWAGLKAPEDLPPSS